MGKKKKIKILLITEYFPPEIGAGSNRAYEHAFIWRNKGAEVTILTGFPDYPDGIVPEEYKGYHFLKEVINGLNIVRTYTYSAPNEGFFKRSISYLSFMFSSVIQGTRKIGKQDIIIATSPPFFVGVAGFLISRFKHVPFVFEVRDLWPDSIVELGQLRNSIIIKLLQMLEKFLYKKAKLIVVVANSSIELIRKKGVSSKKIFVIKNGVDLNKFKLIENEYTSKIKEELQISNKFIVTYIGTLGLSHAIDKVLETANLLIESKDIVFLIIGSGAEKTNLIRKKTELNLKNVIFLNQMPKDKIPLYYSISDVLLVPLKKLDLFSNVIPSKIFEIMAMSKPIIISVDGEARKIVEEAGAGLFAKPVDPSDLKEKIILLKNDPDLCLKFGKNGRLFVQNFFDRENLAINYLQLLESAVKESLK